MSNQIFRQKVPDKLLFNLLDKVCLKTDKYYLVDLNAYRKVVFHNYYEEFQNDLDRANKIYEKNGFGANKYKVYQVSSNDEAKEHRYMWLSTWANDEEYNNAHSEEIDDFWDNYFTKKYEKMLDDHIYRKFFSVK